MSSVRSCRTIGGSCLTGGSSSSTTTNITNNLEYVCREMMNINFDRAVISSNQIIYPSKDVQNAVIVPNGAANLTLFNSASPGASTELGTPNSAFGGPGVGAGGASGAGVNDTEESLVLKADANDTIVFTFENDVIVTGVGILNSNGGNTIVGKNSAGTAQYTKAADMLGVNSHFRYVPDREIVRSLEITLSVDSAITYVNYELCGGTNQIDTFGDNIEGEPNPQTDLCNHLRYTGGAVNASGNYEGSDINGYFYKYGVVAKVVFAAAFSGEISLFKDGNNVFSTIINAKTEVLIDYPLYVDRINITDGAAFEIVKVEYSNSYFYVDSCKLVEEQFNSFDDGTFAESRYFETSDAIVTDTNVAGAWGSPNSDFAGPGVGAGGASGAPGENSTAEGKGITFGDSFDGVPQNGVFVVTFKNPVQVTELRFLTRGATVDATINETLISDYIQIPDLGVNSFYQFSGCIPCVTSLTFSGTIILTKMSFRINTESVLQNPLNLTTEDFSSYGNGEIYIKNDCYQITSADMNNNPPMIVDTSTTSDTDIATPHTDFGGSGVGAGGASGSNGENTTNRGNAIIYSQDGNAEAPTVGLGTFNIVFDKPAFVHEFGIVNAGANATATLLYGDVSEVLNIPDFNTNGYQVLKLNDFHYSYGFGNVTQVQLNLDGGALTHFTYNCDTQTDISCKKTITESFATVNSPYFNHDGTLFDTTSPGGDTQLGTPNSDFAGPGVGTGGNSGKPGENAVSRGNGLRNPTTITFNRDDVQLDYIEFINSESIDNRITLNGNTIYVGDFGTNSRRILYLNDVLVTAAITFTFPGDFVITEMRFKICEPENVSTEIVALPDNATTAVDILSTEDKGSYTIYVQPVAATGASGVYVASSGSSTQAGAVAALSNTTSPTDEVTDIIYSANNKVQLYHSTVKTGGVGADILYRVSIQN